MADQRKATMQDGGKPLNELTISLGKQSSMCKQICSKHSHQKL